MARKRVSLKDKGPETLGLTEKKGKGIDVLFGGPAASTTRPSSESAATPSKTKQPKTEVTNMTAENKDALTNPISDVAAPPPPVIESLPVNEADDHLGSATSGGDDDLGLPVAMEAPPAVIASADLGAREVDELGLPVALETPPTDMTMPVSPTPPPIETAPSAEAFPRPVDTNDLSGLAGEDDDLSGLAGEEAGMPSAAPTVDTTPTVVTPPIEVPSISAVPSAPMTGAPFVESAPVPPPLVTPEPAIPRPVPAPPPVETPVYTPPPSPVTYTPPPVPATPPPPRIESFGGIVTEALPTRIEDLLPQDYQYDTGMVQLAERAKVERDDLLSEKVARYIGKERREALDHEIERLYDVVSSELSDNNEDVSYALKALSEAQDIVLEDIRQYDEALYRVAMVKTMLARRRNLKRWSYTWGSFVFVYAIVWLALFITAIVLTGNINSTVQRFAGQSEGLVAASTAWYSALAGGIGGVIGILYSLYWRVAVKQNFDRQYLMYYLVQPIMGFMLGAVTHLIITAGFLTFNAAGATSDITVILQMVIGFIAGFRQRLVYEMIDKIVQKIAPEESDKSPTSVVPEQ
jgi:hypothetical protein